MKWTLQKVLATPPPTAETERGSFTSSTSSSGCILGRRWDGSRNFKRRRSLSWGDGAAATQLAWLIARYFAVCRLYDVLIICLSFVKQLPVLRDTANEPVSSFYWCRRRHGRRTWCAFWTTILTGWCVCLRRESSEKSTSIWKIKGSLLRKEKDVIIASCVKILNYSREKKVCVGAFNCDVI